MSHKYPLWTEAQAKVMGAPATPIDLARWLRYTYEDVIAKNDERVLAGDMRFPTDYGKGVLNGSLTMVRASEAYAGIVWSPEERSHYTCNYEDLDWAYIIGGRRKHGDHGE